MKKILIIAGVLIITGASAFYFQDNISGLILELKKGQLPPEIKYAPPSPIQNVSTSPAAITPNDSPALPAPTEPPAPADPIPAPAIPAGFNGINLAVPFSAQAPYGDWSAPYGEACEETSALLVDYFYKNKGLTPETAKQEILKIVDWENTTFGYYEHTTAEETSRLIRDYFGYNRVDVDYDISLEDIKTHIIAGRPVIVPLAGRAINNPFYRQPGPIYHMLVIKGITKDGNFITNDVGTKRGYNYVYNADVLYNAIHDAPFGGGELTTLELEKHIPTGRKAIIIIYPN